MKIGLLHILFIIVLSASKISLASDLSQEKYNYKEIKISVDTRIELLTVVQLLADYKILTMLESKYKKDVLEYFGKYKDHEAVSQFKDLADGGFNYDRPIGLMFSLSKPPALDTVISISPYYYELYGGKERILKFIASLRRFYADTNFEEFCKQNAGFYNCLEKAYQDTCSRISIQALEKYYGKEHKEYNIILSPLLHGGGFGTSNDETDGHARIYSIIGPAKIVNNTIVFGNRDRFFELIWHEFGHSFVNSITDRYSESLIPSEDLFSPVKSKMKANAYPNWKTCVTEHLIRAVVIRMLELYIDKPSAVNAWKHDTGKGFIYLDRFLSSLKKYEQSREKYPTLEAFFPNIAEALKTQN